jgi:hypothetical protein
LRYLAVTKALAYNTVAYFTTHPLLANIGIGWRCLAVTNALAYNTAVFISTVGRLIGHVPR